jgi:hypothetical protein
MKLLLFIILLVYLIPANAQSDTILIHFLYGSRPARGYKNSEKKFFGGIKGGHVNIEMAGRTLDFFKGKCPLFPHNKKPTGGFRINHSVYWDTTACKWATVVIPISGDQAKKLDSLFTIYPKSSPYDYAVFGMRCAAASYDVLSKIGLFKPFSSRQNITKNFYPKLLRKRILKWAKENRFIIIQHPGRISRKWETDKGLL